MKEKEMPMEQVPSRGRLAPLFRKLGDLTVTALAWGVLWAVVFLAIGFIVSVVRPQDIDAGEGPDVIARVGFGVGFFSGLVFSVLVSLVESGRPPRGLALARLALWGALASAVWPLATHVDDSMVIILCPLGAVCALASAGLRVRQCISA